MQSPGHNLRCRSRTFVYQNHHFYVFELAVRFGLQLLPGPVSELLYHHHLARIKEIARDVDSQVQKPAGVVSQIEYQPLPRSLLFELPKGSVELRLGNLVKAQEPDVAYAVFQFFPFDRGDLDLVPGYLKFSFFLGSVGLTQDGQKNFGPAPTPYLRDGLVYFYPGR